MECKKGSVPQESTHVIQTEKTAKDWARRDVFMRELPLKVVQHKTADGRIHSRVYDCHGKLIARRG